MMSQMDFTAPLTDIGFFGFVRLTLIEDAEKEDPGQLGDIVHRAGHVGAAHDVADGFYGAVDRYRLLRLRAPHAHRGCGERGSRSTRGHSSSRRPRWSGA